ncbi:MAG TPA: hypothetical protein VM580_10795 [Labilithrix sp.]|nr:hypothetical protein [Labilithrix sp.]
MLQNISYVSGDTKIPPKLDELFLMGKHFDETRREKAPLFERGQLFVTVLFNLFRSWPSANDKKWWRPGHTALMIWQRRVATSFTIFEAATPWEAVQAEMTTKFHNIAPWEPLDLWLYTRPISWSQAENMRRFVQEQVFVAEYVELYGSRHSGTFNCVTFVDSILHHAGNTPETRLSSNYSPLSMGTPYLYSLSFHASRTWSCGVLPGHSSLAVPATDFESVVW